MPIATPDKDLGPRRRRRPKKTPQRTYTLPRTFRPQVTTDRPAPVRKGPPSPQRTGGTPSRPQPITRKRTAPPRTERVADSHRTRVQRRHDEAIVHRNIRQARRDYVARSGRGSFGAILRVATGGATPKARRTGRIVPGAQAQPLANLPVLSIPTVRAQDPSITARKLAPVLKVLDQTSRPVHAVAAATRADIADVKAHGFKPFGTASGRKAARGAAVKGFELKDRSLFSDVLGDVGVKNKAVRGAAGFALDVALDPLTYLTAGGSSAAGAAARSAARSAERAALRSVAAREAARKAGEYALAHGATPGQASRIARQAAQRHARRAGKRAGEQAARGKATNTGLDIRFAGRSAPGLVQGTSALKRAPRAVADRAGLSGGRLDRAQQGVRNAARSSAAEFSPAITPVGVGRTEYQAMRRAARTARAQRQRGDVRAALVAQSFVDRVGPKNFQRVIYAIEEGTTKQLPKGLRGEAARFTQLMRRLLKEERRAGIKVGDRTGGGRGREGEVWYHASRRGLAERGRDTVSFDAHAGTRKAAEDRAKAFKGGDHKIEAFRLAPDARTPAKGAKGSRSNPYTEAEIGSLPPALLKKAGVSPWRYQQALRELRERGIDAVYYRNEVEDKGKLSLLVLDRRRLVADAGDGAKPDVAGYVKHLRLKDDGTSLQRAGRSGARKVAPDFAKRRTEGTLREKNTANPGSYSEDLGQVTAQRASKSSRAVAAAKLNQALAKTGRAVPRGGDLRDAVADGESVYRVKGADLLKLDVGKAHDRNLIEKVGRGRFVVLNDHALERTAGTVAPAGARTSPGVFFDKAQGIWKIGATVVNPGYYVRNYFGEAQNAYLKENPLRLTRNAVVAGRALKEVKKREEALRRGEKYVPGKHGDLIATAEDVGAIRAGQYAREVGQLLSKESRKNRAGKLKGAGPLRRAARVRDNIEDQFRLASYKGGLDRGRKPEEAMQRASVTHFDYGDLTETERKVLRRVAPFYTFTARNVPLQIKMLLTRPGKFAQYEKIRQEFAKAFGFEPGWEQRTSEYEQRGAAIPVKWKGKEFTIGLGPSGLPLTDLNEFAVPSTARGAAALSAEWMSRAASMVTPAVKSPVELWANFSFFFRDQLERDTSPLVPAPAWAQHLPRAIKDMTGLVPDYYDRKTGKYTWGWRAKADYLVNQVPGPAAFASRLTKESSRSGQSAAMKTLAYFGPRVREVDSYAQMLNNLYEERDIIDRKQAALRQRNIKTGRVPKAAEKEFLALRQRARVVGAGIKQLQLRVEAPGRAVTTPASADPVEQAILGNIGGGGSAVPAAPPAADPVEEAILRNMKP